MPDLKNIKTLLSTYSTGRDNNLNLIRFIAATLVLVSHSYPLALGGGHFDPIKVNLGISGGHIAVDIFFITSGFLITGSFFSRGDILAFAWSRILRIYPALIMAMVFCVFGVGLYFTTLTPSEYLSNSQTQKYFIKNILLFFGVNLYLPGVFADVPYPGDINSSLWTLPYEIKMYSLLAMVLSIVIFIERRLAKPFLKVTFLLLAVGAISANIINHFHFFWSVYFIRLFSMFFVGAAFYVWREHIVLVSKKFWWLNILLLVSALHIDVFFIIYSITLPYLIFHIAYVPGGKIRRFNTFGDYSYGLYIYAFPVQQSVVALIPGISPLAMMFISFVFTFIFAFLSWHLIEKKFLKLKAFSFL